MLALIVIVPLLAATAAAALISDYSKIKYIALAGSVMSLLLVPLISGGESQIAMLVIGSQALNITTLSTPLGAIMLLVALVIGSIVILCSFGFITLPSEQRKYYVELLALESATVLLFISGNFIVLIAAWEFLSVASYLITGFWSSRDRANAAARKLVTVMLIGDIALVASSAIFFSTFGTLEFSGILNALSTTKVPVSAALLLIIAVMTKSAQFPFNGFLPDSTEGPEPAVALLHSGSLAIAGAFVAILFLPIIAAAGMLQLVFYVGMVTVVIGTVGALRSNSVGRVISYSTIQGLGLVFIAIGKSSPLAAAYFIFAQCFGRTLLFIISGISQRATGKESLSEVGSLYRNRLVYVTALFGILSIVGILPFAEFFALQGVFGIASASSDIISYVLFSAIAFGTGVYAFRWLELQTRKVQQADVLLNYDVQPKSTTLSLVLLAIATLLASAGFFLVPQIMSGNGLSFVPTGGAGLGFSVFDAIVIIAPSAAGSVFGYLLYNQRKRRGRTQTAPARGPSVAGIAVPDPMNIFYSLFAEFVVAFADGIYYFDTLLNELYERAGHTLVEFDNTAKKASARGINTYIFLLIAGIILLLAFIVIFI